MINLHRFLYWALELFIVYLLYSENFISYQAFSPISINPITTFPLTTSALSGHSTPHQLSSTVYGPWLMRILTILLFIYLLFIFYLLFLYLCSSSAYFVLFLHSPSFSLRCCAQDLRSKWFLSCTHCVRFLPSLCVFGLHTSASLAARFYLVVLLCVTYFGLYHGTLPCYTKSNSCPPLLSTDIYLIRLF